MNANEIFEAISHPTRIRILEILAEKPLGFADLKRKLNIKSSGKLDFHLKKLENLITVNQDGKYILTEKGYAALNAIKVINRYGWQKRALYINIIAYIAFNAYFAVIRTTTWLKIILPITTAWIIFYTYWTKRRRGLAT
ncbi:MAG: helix-turn-helix domain-containing protein [archaeon GB-1867-035]|nr:helix-turn-helix domain-containing protein [Candidatus Culexmicrobium profundum]